MKYFSQKFIKWNPSKCQLGGPSYHAWFLHWICMIFIFSPLPPPPDAINTNALIIVVDIMIIKMLITIKIVRWYKRIFQEIRENCEQVRYIGLLLDCLMMKQLWSYPSVNTIAVNMAHNHAILVQLVKTNICQVLFGSL